MVQIIQSQPVSRQNALLDALSQGATGFVTGYAGAQKNARQEALDLIKGSSELTKATGKVVSPQDYKLLMNELQNSGIQTQAQPQSIPMSPPQQSAWDSLKAGFSNLINPSGNQNTNQDQAIVQGLDYSAIGGNSNKVTAESGSQIPGVLQRPDLNIPKQPLTFQERIANAPLTPEAQLKAQELTNKMGIESQRQLSEQHRQKSEELAAKRFDNMQQQQIAANKKSTELASAQEQKMTKKENIQSQKELDSFTKMYDPFQSSARSPIGKEVSRFQQSVHTLNLIHGIDDLDHVSTMKKREIAISLATMLSPSGVPHLEDIKHLDSATLNSKIAEGVQYFTGQPAPTNSGEMVKQLKESLVNQQGVSLNTIKDYQDTILESHADQIANNPEKYKKIIEKASILNKLQNKNTSQKNDSSPWLKYRGKP